MNAIAPIFIIVLIVVFVLIIRLFGAWMLRIDEVIKYQKEILAELKKRNGFSEFEIK